MFEIFADPNTWISLITLTLMEIVLGIDNIIFISIVAGKLPANEQGKARTIGLMLALIFRVFLLLFISHIVAMKDPLFTLDLPFNLKDFGVTGRDIILFAGGLFLIAKSTTEIHGKLEGEEEDEPIVKKVAESLGKVIVQVVIIDIVFSFDSILTAEGFKILAVEQVSNSVSLKSFQPEKDQKYALVFGNEVFGVEEKALALADTVLEIPQFGTKHSLNISVALGIVVWDLVSKLS